MHLRAVSLGVVLYLFWILLSGIYTPYFLTVGAIGAALISAASYRAGLVDEESHPIEKLPALITYNLWLLSEIIKSGLEVSKIVLSPKLPISPTMIRFKPNQATDLGKVLHANSITLTPGTITVEIEREEFLIHALTEDGAKGCIDSEMNRRLAEFER